MVDVIHHYNYQLWWQLTTTVVAYIHHTSMVDYIHTNISGLCCTSVLHQIWCMLET